MSLSFTDAAMTYLGHQIGANNKVPAGQSFLIAIAIMEAEGDDSLFLIKGTYSNGAVSNLDKTFAEITAASGNDKVIVMKLTDSGSYYYLPCAKLDSTEAVFADDIESGLKVTLSSADAVTVGTATASVPMTDTTWAALKALRDGGNLVPGMQYRITDYNTIVTGYYDLSALAEGVQGYVHYGVSAGHQFDVIVTADDDSTLNENARAALHDGDTYFANSNLAAWELKYCLDNDATRFSFANSSGKGVIYWMKDEFDNECGYDFKNWQFVRYALKLADATADYTPEDGGMVYNASTMPNRYGSVYHVFMSLSAFMESGTYVNPFYLINQNRAPDYDFAAGANILGTIQMASIDATYKATFNADLYYTFDYFDASTGLHEDLSLNHVAGGNCKNNVMPTDTDMLSSYMGTNDKIGVDGNVFESSSLAEDGNGNSVTPNVVENEMETFCFQNTFGDRCYSNVFSQGCYSNVFSQGCSSNVFSQWCYSNVFSQWCSSNVFSQGCYSNVFSQWCSSNVFSQWCYSNVFSQGCSSNVFEQRCWGNTFGMDFCGNTVHQDFQYNTVGASNQDNEFYSGIDFSEFCGLCYQNTFEFGCRGVKVIDPISQVTIPSSIASSNCEIRCLPGSDAAVITKNSDNTENAVKTTDGGTTWTAA